MFVLALITLPQTIMGAMWLYRDSTKNRVWLKRMFVINIFWHALFFLITAIVFLALNNNMFNYAI